MLTVIDTKNTPTAPDGLPPVGQSCQTFPNTFLSFARRQRAQYPLLYGVCVWYNIFVELKWLAIHFFSSKLGANEAEQLSRDEGISLREACEKIADKYSVKSETVHKALSGAHKGSETPHKQLLLPGQPHSPSSERAVGGVLVGIKLKSSTLFVPTKGCPLNGTGKKIWIFLRSG
jgi:hypothetical protein